MFAWHAGRVATADSCVTIKNPFPNTDLRSIPAHFIEHDRIPIQIVLADWLAPVAAIQDVINRTGIFHAQLAGRAGKVAKTASCANIKNRPFYMEHSSLNRLLVVGPASDLKALDRNEEWAEMAGAKYIELLEHSPTRHAWQFETEAPPLQFLRVISRRWPSLTFVLDYDREAQRLKGLVRARNGRLRHGRINY